MHQLIVSAGHPDHSRGLFASLPLCTSGRALLLLLLLLLLLMGPVLIGETAAEQREGLARSSGALQEAHHAACHGLH